MLPQKPSPEMAETCLEQLQEACISDVKATEALDKAWARLMGDTPVGDGLPAAFCVGTDRCHIHILKADGTFGNFYGTREEVGCQELQLVQQCQKVEGMAGKALCYLETFEPILFKGA